MEIRRTHISFFKQEEDKLPLLGPMCSPYASSCSTSDPAHSCACGKMQWKIPKCLRPAWISCLQPGSVLASCCSYCVVNQPMNGRPLSLNACRINQALFLGRLPLIGAKLNFLGHPSDPDRSVQGLGVTQSAWLSMYSSHIKYVTYINEAKCIHKFYLLSLSTWPETFRDRSACVVLGSQLPVFNVCKSGSQVLTINHPFPACLENYVFFLYSSVCLIFFFILSFPSLYFISSVSLPASSIHWYILVSFFFLNQF